LYEGMREWQNTAKVWMDLNHLPTFKGVDLGIARRLRVIPFDRKFADAEQDKQLVDKLRAELPGVLAWAVAGCRAWREHGLQAPAAVNLATRQYRDEQNHLPAFVDETYTLNPDGMIPAKTLQAEYAGFCEQRGEPAMSYQRKVTKYLRDGLQLRLIHTRAGNVWAGLAPRLRGGERAT
jgi:putative DNA primase/helicase